MAISSVTSKVIYVGDGATLIFAYPFKVFAEGDLTVSEYFTATGSVSVLALNTDYIVDGIGIDAGGNVTLSGSYTSLPTGSQLVIQREVDLTQEVDYVENDPFPAETHERALDRITMIAQQLQEQVYRSVKSDISTTSAGVIYIDADASASSAVVAVAQVVLCSASALAAASSATVAVAQAVLSSAHAVVSVSSATVAVNEAVLASSYAGAIDFSKDTDGTLTSNSDLFVATQKATKTYADTKAAKGANSDITSLTGLTTVLSTGQGGTGSNQNANTASGVVVLDASSKIPVAQLGAWVDKSASYGAQQASTDGFVVVSLVHAGGDSVVTSIGYTDGNAAPTTIRTRAGAVGSQATHVSFDNGFCMPVKKNDYWKVTNDGGTQLVYWIPLGS